MPLVVPGLQSASGSGSGSSDQKSLEQEWASRLMGKKLSESHSETSFAKSDLPSKHRVVEEGGFGTMDFVPERLNIHLDKDGTVRKVNQG